MGNRKGVRIREHWITRLEVENKEACRARVLQALEQCNYVMSEAGYTFGITQPCMKELVQRLGIDMEALRKLREEPEWLRRTREELAK